MINSMNAKAKQVGDRLIDMSTLLSAKMDTWDNSPKGPESLSNEEHAGFINSKETANTGVDLVIDVLAPKSTKEAQVRTWAIECVLDENGRERFNNISLSFAADYEKASELTTDYASLTREDIRGLLHDASTKLDRVVISNMTGRDKKTQELLGQRYDITVSETTSQDEINDICNALDIVLPVLEKSAASEVN